MNILAEYPKARKYLYALLWVAGLALGATAAGYGASDAGIPGWYAPVAAVYAFLGAGLGYTAQANTPKAEA
jgi:hypothetical protein